MENAAAHLESVETCARTAVQRDFMESIATRNVTVLTMDAVTAHMEPVCVIQGSTAGSVTYLAPSGHMDLAAQQNASACNKLRLSAIGAMGPACVSLAIRERPATESVILVTTVQDASQNASVQQECPAITLPDNATISAQPVCSETTVSKSVLWDSLELDAPSLAIVMEPHVTL